MTRRHYLNLLLAQSADWVRASMSNPSPGMTRTHVALHAIALRRLT